MLTALLALAAGLLGLLLLLVVLARSRATERRYRTLLDNLPQTSVVLFDHDLRLRLIAGALPGLGDREPEEVQGMRLQEAVSSERAALLGDHYEAALAGEDRSLEYASALDERDYWLRVVPVREGGRIVGGLAVSQDITDRKRAEREREHAEIRRQLMIDVMNEAYVANDADGLVTDWNERATKLFGYSREEAIGRSNKELIIPAEDHADFDWLIDRFLRGEGRSERLDLRVERTAVHKDGHRFTVELAAATLEHGGAVSLHSFMHDITDRKRSEAEAEAHAADLESLAEATGALARSTAPEAARDGICRAASAIAEAEVGLLFEPDASGRGLRVTASTGAVLTGEVLPFVGSSSGAVRAFTGLEPLFVGDIASDEAVDQSIADRLGVVSALWVPVMRDRTALGVITVAWRQARPELPDRLWRTMGLVAAEAAVAIERAALLDRLARMARTDDLTGLPNRRAWDQELEREMARARRDGSPLTIAMVDLDRFKDYNDEHGHLAGDRLLKEAAGTWRGVLRETDLLTRYGGEEFAIALPACDPDAARALIERLRAVTPAEQSCSAGVATWDRSETPDELLGRADDALYAAKQGGRNRTVSA